MDQNYGLEYSRLYRQHWWWQSRERILVDVMAKLPLPRPAQILDFGCGDGVFLPVLSQLGSVFGVEADQSLLTPGNPYRESIFANLTALDDRQPQFDLITALDVIEHIEDDRNIVTQLVQRLKPGGYLVITVPAFTCLWDRHDEINHHFRRYTKARLDQLLPEGVDCRMRYLFRSLFPLKWIIGRMNRLTASRIEQHMVPPPLVNSLMRAFCWIEWKWFGWMPLPFGTSVLAVVQRRERPVARLKDAPVEANLRPFVPEPMRSR